MCRFAAKDIAGSVAETVTVASGASCTVEFMTEAYPWTQAQPRLGELVRQVAREHQTVTLTDAGEPVAVLISAEDLRALQRTQDEADLALSRSIRSRSGPGLTHEEFMAQLDAEDHAAATRTEPDGPSPSHRR